MSAPNQHTVEQLPLPKQLTKVYKEAVNATNLKQKADYITYKLQDHKLDAERGHTFNIKVLAQTVPMQGPAQTDPDLTNKPERDFLQPIPGKWDYVAPVDNPLGDEEAKSYAVLVR